MENLDPVVPQMQSLPRASSTSIAEQPLSEDRTPFLSVDSSAGREDGGDCGGEDSPRGEEEIEESIEVDEDEPTHPRRGGILPNVPDSPVAPRPRPLSAHSPNNTACHAGSSPPSDDADRLNSALREGGFAPLDGPGDVVGARRRLAEVLDQFSRRGALVQGLIVAKEKAKVEERALQQRAAYHARDAANLRRRLESAQHLGDGERAARSPPGGDDRARLASRLAAALARSDEMSRALRAREAYAEDLQVAESTTDMHMLHIQGYACVPARRSMPNDKAD